MEKESQTEQVYTPPFFLFNGHLETIFPALFRIVQTQPPFEEKIPTPDGDFLELDWYKNNSNNLVIICHGLEGNSRRSYVLGMVKASLKKNFDVVAWNYRGCGKEINLLPKFYHSGATEDLETVTQYAEKLYRNIFLVGFSLGGNLVLKFLGEKPERSHVIKKAVVFSVPMDLSSCCDQISRPKNFIYSQRFLNSLKAKVRKKPFVLQEFARNSLDKIKNLREFDNQITGPLHGFNDAADYYEKCSSLNFAGKITCPTLIISSLNDPLLTPSCIPVNKFTEHNYVKLLSPEKGGHTGFVQFGQNGLYWSEIKTMNFFTKVESDQAKN